MASKTIKGRIIRIVDSRTVIINLGSKDGVSSSSVFKILGDPEAIIDPFSREELGEVNIVKSKVKASLVEERFTIATTKWTDVLFKTSISTFFTSPSDRLFQDSISEEHDEGELNVKKEDLKPWKAKSEIPVKVGDEVETEIYVADKKASVKEMIESASKIIVKESKKTLKNFDIVTSPENADYIINFMKIDGSVIATKIINRSGLNLEIIKEEILKQIPNS